MLAIDLTGKRALVAGVADDRGFGFSIAKAFAEAGATVSVATWPPMLKMFKLILGRPETAPALTLADGTKMAFEAIYPFDADYDRMEDVPADVRDHRRYRDMGDFSMAGLTAAVSASGGVDIVVHSLANAPEAAKPLLETSRRGYLSAVSTSAYSNISLVQHLAPHMKRGGSFLSLSYVAAERVVPGYGGGMSSAKAALESDTRVLAYEAGRRWGHRVNVISAGPYASRAAEAIGPIDQMIEYAAQASPLPTPITAADVGATAAFLSSPLASGITGTVVYVDKGFASMGVHLTQEA
ncbi:MAG TPA: enoyl-[acyl-carrier-protein] reductase [Kofleriaceae bacterium]|jgi:enoyl-[acyl-carrier protein] reductase I